MSKVKRLLLGVIVGMMALSCAVDGGDITEDFSMESYMAWIERYAPDADSVYGGVYIEFKERADNWRDLDTAELDSVYVRLNYTGYTLAGDIFETRDSALAKQMGTWLPTTHFVDDYVPYSLHGKLSVGLMVGIDSMRVGDSARIYMPSKLGYTSTMNENTGYAGTTSYYTGFPIYFDVRLNAIVRDPSKAEIEEVDKWVSENWKGSVIDTIAEGFYLRKVLPNPVGDTITSDSTVTYDYDSYFLDGKLLKTTSDSLAKAMEYYKAGESYNSVTITSNTLKDTTTTSTYSVFPKSLLKMQYGETAEVVCISTYAAGAAGDRTNVPEIQYYMPQRFIIKAETNIVEKDDEADEEEDTKE